MVPISVMHYFRRVLPSTVLAIAALSATTAADTERIDLLPALGYGALIVAAFVAYAAALALRLIPWLERHLRPDAIPQTTTTASPRWLLTCAGTLLLGWAILATEQLIVEWTVQPTVTQVELSRIDCKTRRAVDKAGNWCFHLAGSTLPEPGAALYTFRLPPAAFKVEPPIGSAVRAQLASYDSLLFGRNAYSKVTVPAN